MKVYIELQGDSAGSAPSAVEIMGTPASICLTLHNPDRSIVLDAEELKGAVKLISPDKRD